MKRFLTQFQKLISMITVLVLLLNLSAFTSASQEETFIEQQETDSKIDNDVREAMAAADDDELIPISIWMNEIDSDELNALILERSGLDPKIYENEALFNEFILPEIEEEAQEKQSQNVDTFRSGAYSNAADNAAEQAQEELIRRITNNKVQEYIHQKRLITREEYSRKNNEFLQNEFKNRADRDIIYCSQFAPIIIVEATKTEIEMLALNDSVESISYYVEETCKPLLNDALSQVGVYCDGGTGYDLPDGGRLALTGLGVKIGVIEMSDGGLGGRYNASANLLNGNTNIHFIENIRTSGVSVPYVQDLHATTVVSIIAGQQVNCNGTTYCGVVPGATVYQTPAALLSDIRTGIDACLQYDVDIINISIGGTQATDYSDLEKQIDYYVRHNNVIIVIAAGNEGDGTGIITKPGRSLNAITVGNVQTKELLHEPQEVLSPPYSICPHSSYYEPNYCANKPDLVAPGCLRVPANSNNFIETYGEGTSFSAPIVTGIAAQLIDLSPYYYRQTLRVKTALLVGADLSNLDTTNDTQSSPFFYDKFGAGMVNAINSTTDVQHINMGQLTTSATTTPVYYTSGQKVRAVLSFNKNNDSDITSVADLDDLDFLFIKQGGTTIGYSVSSKNNNEIIEATIPSNGYYYFKVYVHRVVDSNNPPTAVIAYKVS